MKTVICVMVACVLAGCAASGVKVSERHMESLQPGVTTRADVIRLLGEPTSVSTHFDGTSMMVYSHVRAQARPASFIPIVGAFAGGSDVSASTVMLRFDASGRLMDTSTNQTNVGTGLGFQAGPAVQPLDQPRVVE